jgi:intraflagellar transport protein 74
MATNQIDLSPESLKKIARKAKLEKKLNELKLEQEELNIRAEIEGIDITNDLEKLNQEITVLEKENENLTAYEHPIIEFVQKQSLLQDRLKKLEVKKNQIKPKVYESLKNEYLSEKELINNRVENTLRQLTKIKQEALNATSTLRYAIEELSVRKEIEDIPDNVYSERISDLRKELTQSEELINSVTILLDLVNQ